MPVQVVDEPSQLRPAIQPTQEIYQLFVIQVMGKQRTDNDVDSQIAFEAENIRGYIADG